MGLNKYKLGSFLSLYNKRCGKPNLSEWDISGVNSDKEFFEPSRQVGTDTSNYKNVPPGYFACNLMHVGRDRVLPIALNHTSNIKVVSPAYTIFKINNDAPLLSDYFFLMLKSNERDRYFWFHTDASIRDGMTWEDFCELDIELPPLSIQQKYVDIYNAMLTNQQNYERGLDDLKITCDSFIEELRRKSPSEEIGPYIAQEDEINLQKLYSSVQGVESSGSFMNTRANMQDVDISKYTVVHKGDIAYNPSRINLGSIAIYTGDIPCIVSPMYSVFKVSNRDKLLPEYLMLWFSRLEFHRYTWFYAAGSVRDTFDFGLMKQVRIPIPSLDIQHSIVGIYSVLQERKKINDLLKGQIKSICPILIKGSIEEGKLS